MLFRSLGRTGVKLSVLGFGTKYLPENVENDKRWVSIDNAIKAMHRSFELGINHVDTAYTYNNGLSETATSQALKSWPGKIHIGAKIPTHLIKKRGDYRRYLEEQLTRLKVACIDFYYFDNVNYQSFLSIDKRANWVREAEKAKDEGLIKHISLSFNSPAEEMKLFTDMRLFSVISCGYNLLNFDYNIAIEYAAKKGIGIITTEPLAGGKIVQLPAKIRTELNSSTRNNTELGLRFVIANPSITATLSSMKTVEMVEENIFYVSDSTPLAAEELKNINLYMSKLHDIAKKICTNCGDCLPCPQEVNIPYIFQLYIYYQVYGLKDYAQKKYSSLETDPLVSGKNALSCFHCGLCIQKCPHQVEIADQLKEFHKTLSPYYRASN
ncbi:MAG TPA: aldo/keto reductase [Firmicutes bacterium]|nr:aldo/keto reductase [Bacillota bacterium]